MIKSIVIGLLPGVESGPICGFIIPEHENEGIHTDIEAYFEGKNVFFFLPCRAELTSVVYYAVDSNGEYLERFETDFSSGPVMVQDYLIVAMKSRIPSVEIVTDDYHGTMEDVHEDDEHQTNVYGDMIVSVSDGMAESLGCPSVYRSSDRKKNVPHSITLRGRGNSTWSGSKRPYIIELEEIIPLLNMAVGDKWILLANQVDHTLLRNGLFIDFARGLDVKFVPDVEPVDLFINGEYRGSYLLTSKIELGMDRVEIDEGDYFYRLGLNSGYYREIEAETLWDDDNYVELINYSGTEQDDEAFAIIQDVFTAIEDVDSSRITELIDMESWAVYYWVQEFSKNTDACHRSLYLHYRKKDRKVYIVSAWDLDRTAGTIEQYNKDLDYLMPTGWCVQYDQWFVPLFEHKEFEDEVRRVYYDKNIDGILSSLIDEIPMRRIEINESAVMNFVKWDDLERPLDGYYNKIEEYMGDASYGSEIEWLHKWCEQRRIWLKDVMSHEDYRKAGEQD